MLPAVQPVGKKIQDNEIKQETDKRMLRQTGQEIFQIKRHDIPHAQPSVDAIYHWRQQKKQQQGRQTKTIDQGIDDIRAQGATFRPALQWAPFFKRAKKHRHKQHLENADDKQFGGIKCRVGVNRKSQRIDSREDQALKYLRVQLRKPLNHQIA